MYPMSTMQHPVRVVRRTALRRVTAYRRLGYRVVVEQGMDTPMHWKVYRPWLRTISVSGIAPSRDEAIAAANAWIRADIDGAKRRLS
ncbi:MAG TPA: hypothetical protein VJ724_13865 [Tahibacter sp.]|nr:hypothetical protein [Tahibacter sp.]